LKKEPISPNLKGKNYSRAQKILFDVVTLLETNGINYHLEGGTLLGIVRDKDLIPWDHDLDLSIPDTEVDKLCTCLRKLYKKGYKVNRKYSQIDFGPIEKGDCQIVKVKNLGYSALKFFHKSFRKNYVILDIFVKTSDGTHVYWQAMKKMMKVEKKYYEGYEELEFLNHSLRAPKYYKEYLTEKYGDWSVPVQDWVAGRDEKTICSDLNSILKT